MRNIRLLLHESIDTGYHINGWYAKANRGATVCDYYATSIGEFDRDL